MSRESAEWDATWTIFSIVLKCSTTAASNTAAFRKMKRPGYPAGLIDVSASDGVGDGWDGWAVVESNQEERELAEWENILHDIENAFQLLKDGETHDRSKAQHEVIIKGLGLFAKYYEHLWV